MVDIAYKNGADFLPPEAMVKAERPKE